MKNIENLRRDVGDALAFVMGGPKCVARIDVRTLLIDFELTLAKLDRSQRREADLRANLVEARAKPPEEVATVQSDVPLIEQPRVWKGPHLPEIKHWWWDGNAEEWGKCEPSGLYGGNIFIGGHGAEPTEPPGPVHSLPACREVDWLPKPEAEPVLEYASPRVWEGPSNDHHHWYWEGCNWGHYEGALRPGDIFVPACQPEPSMPPGPKCDLPTCREVDWDPSAAEPVVEPEPEPEPAVVEPRIWQGGNIDTGHWYWSGGQGRWTHHVIALVAGNIFVPGGEPKPTMPPKDRVLLAECREVDWETLPAPAEPPPAPTIDPRDEPRVWMGGATLVSHWYGSSGAWTKYDETTTTRLFDGEIFIRGDAPEPTEPPPSTRTGLPECREIDWCRTAK